MMKGPTDEEIFNHMMPEEVDDEIETCDSCDDEFIAEEWNDRPEGLFCDECLEIG